MTTPTSEAFNGQLQRGSVADQVIAQIKQMIIGGDLTPGQALPSERQLAATLQVSRPTLRAALQALAAMNILHARHGGGTYVSSLTPTELAQPIRFLLQVDGSAYAHLFEVRQSLEGSAARLAAERITADEVSQLQSLVEQGQKFIEDPEQFLQADLALHDAIVAAVHNPLLQSLYDSIAQLSLQSRRRTAASRAVRQAAHHDHEILVAALASGHAERAGTAMRDHLENVRRRWQGDDAGGPEA